MGNLSLGSNSLLASMEERVGLWPEDSEEEVVDSRESSTKGVRFF